MSTQTKPPSLISSSRIERLRDGFHLIVTETSRTPPLAPSGDALLLICPLGQRRDAAVRLSTVRGPLPSAPDDGAVCVVIEIALFRGILGADFERLPARAVAAISGGEATIPRTAELTLAAHAIRGCGHRGAIRNVFLKSKALEMLALTLGSLREDADARDPVPERDVRALTRARDLLLERLDDPPRLNELAATAGMCETRLKVGFKRLFGDTPAGYSRRARMASAREMLVERRCRVSEAAVNVGYTNVSHFIDAFVREFGVRPGHLLRMAGGTDPLPR